jgi:hypothetical protein
MRVALCLFGQPRAARRGLATFYRFMRRQHEDVHFDVFFHAWHDPAQTTYAACPWRNIPAEDLRVDPHVIDFLVDALQPIDYLVDPPQTVFDTPPELDASPFWTNTAPELRKNLVNTLSQLYSRQQVYELVKKHGVTYDVVIASRFDFFQPIGLDVASLDVTKLYVSNLLRPRHIFPDQFIIGNPAMVFSLMNAYNSLPSFLFSPHIVERLRDQREPAVLSSEMLLFAAFLNEHDVDGNVVYTDLIPSCF